MAPKAALHEAASTLVAQRYQYPLKVSDVFLIAWK
jgi:hypothetical protein